VERGLMVDYRYLDTHKFAIVAGTMEYHNLWAFLKVLIKGDCTP
jgi:hypothetical protein